MPKILERLKSQLEKKGMNESSAYAVATKTLQKSGSLKPGTNKPTAKGIRRGEMGAEGRAKDRASRYGSGKHKPSDYKYSKKTNRATLRGK